jgi:hypothetical protein
MAYAALRTAVNAVPVAQSSAQKYRVNEPSRVRAGMTSSCVHVENPVGSVEVRVADVLLDVLLSLVLTHERPDIPGGGAGLGAQLVTVRTVDAEPLAVEMAARDNCPLVRKSNVRLTV